jgi:hypothetical protein
VTKNAKGDVVRATPPRVPPNVKAALDKLPPGKHALSDGTQWKKFPNGVIMQTK